MCLEVEGFRVYINLCFEGVGASIHEGIVWVSIQEGQCRCVLEGKEGLELGFRVRRGILI